MPDSPIIIAAIIGADTIRGKELREALVNSGIRIEDIRTVGEEEIAESLFEHPEGRDILIDLTRETLAGAALVFLCGTRESSLSALGVVAEGGDPRPIIIDLSGATVSDADVPKMTVSLPRVRKLPRLLAIPDSPAVGLATLLDACLEAGALEFASASCLVPVSDLGDVGNQALHRQAVELLNFQAIPEDILGRQLIFNVHPAFSPILAGGRSEFEELIYKQVLDLLGLSELPLSVIAARMPLFFSTIISLSIKFSPTVSEADLRDCLSKKSVFQVGKVSSDPTLIPSPIDSLESDHFQVGRILSVPGLESAFQLWMSFDNIRRGGVLDAVELADIILQEEGLIRTH
jgi:aspartate-semialdehyde dehydrogenase